MEHACEKCGAPVEDGIAFCPQCSAPQIHVGTLSAVEATAAPEIVPAQASYNPSAIQWSQALPSAALAGLIAAVLMFVRLGAFGLGMVAGGALAVVFYRRRHPMGQLTPGVGARLGAVSGILGFGIFAVFAAIEVSVFHGGGELRAAMLEAIQQSAARTSDPQAQQMLDYLKSPPGMVVMMVLGLGVVFVAFLIFSTLGGAIGAALLRGKNRG